MPTNRFLNHLRTRLLGPPAPQLGARLQTAVKLLVVVEGQHDVTFLAASAESCTPTTPCCPTWASWSVPAPWSCYRSEAATSWPGPERMAALGLPEFHLLDREVPPATERRQQPVETVAVEIVNQRLNCRACMTDKRAIENYLHPLAV